MKGNKLCYGLLSVLFIIFGVLFVGCSDTNAYQYSINGLMVHAPIVISSSSGDGTAQSMYYQFNSDMTGHEYRSASYLRSGYNSTSRKCEYTNYEHGGYEAYSSSVYFDAPFYGNEPIAHHELSGNQLCRTMYAYGTSDIWSDDDSYISIPEFDIETVPLNTRLNVNSLLPYNYMYNILPFKGEHSYDGVRYSSTLELSGMLNKTADYGDSDYVSYSDSISGFSFPLNFSAENGNWNFGSYPTIDGYFEFSSSVSDIPSGSLTFDLLYSDGLNGSQTLSFPCSTTVDSENLRLYYTCTTFIPTTISSGFYSLAMVYSPSNNQSFTSVNQFVTFSDITLVTNGDSTYGGQAGYDISGSYPQVSPGNPQNNVDDADWFASLSNMFAFSFINPFAPIFQMFNNSSCASIPTLASMLHSNETQVCPWFNSTVRDILTPVLSIASMMLVFGFSVRWLGSRSGNFIEDSGGVDSGKYHFENRFRRNK